MSSALVSESLARSWRSTPPAPGPGRPASTAWAAGGTRARAAGPARAGRRLAMKRSAGAQRLLRDLVAGALFGMHAPAHRMAAELLGGALGHAADFPRQCHLLGAAGEVGRGPLRCALQLRGRTARHRPVDRG